MKPFDAKEATIGCEVVTRDGRKGIVLHLNGRGYYPVTVLIHNEESDKALNFTNAGINRLDNVSSLDIFFPTKKHEGWVTLWNYGQKKRIGYKVFSSKEECEKEHGDNGNFLAAAHIEWEA